MMYIIDLNRAELKYPLRISVDKCNGIYDVLSPKICLSKEAKDINFYGFNMATNKNEAETMTKHISCDCKCKFSGTTCNSNQKME